MVAEPMNYQKIDQNQAHTSYHIFLGKHAPPDPSRRVVNPPKFVLATPLCYVYTYYICTNDVSDSTVLTGISLEMQEVWHWDRP